ncbi:NAD-dependent epimerase/dehydratase family protein [Planctomycetota bacterium]
MKRVFVTGAAGFIGSNLADRLLQAGLTVVGWDNLSTGREEFLREASGREGFRFVKGDNLDFDSLATAMEGCDTVFHLAANADVRFGLDHPQRDVEQNIVATSNVLEAMRANEIKTIAFASSGSVYGEPDVFPTPEDAPFPVQTSLYGASKAAAEGLISAYCEGYGFHGHVFRFVSVLGERYTHGHVYDFFKQLRAHPDRLRVLGDGRQRKSYMYVQDCVDGMLLAVENAEDRFNVFNLGTDAYCEVRDSIKWICEQLEVSPRVEYTGGERGWVGDSPFIFLDSSRIRGLGWQPKLDIRGGVVRTVQFLAANPWALHRA